MDWCRNIFPHTNATELYLHLDQWKQLSMMQQGTNNIWCAKCCNNSLGTIYRKQRVRSVTELFVFFFLFSFKPSGSDYHAQVTDKRHIQYL